MADAMADAGSSAAPTWLPLESNPEILNGFARRLGCPSSWGFCDVFGLDDELLCMIPQPCAALCLLFPSQNISKPRRAELRARVAAAPQTVSPKLWFATQHDDVGNACGTIATLHALSNAAAGGAFGLDSGPLSRFVEKTAGMGYNERGWALASASELQELSQATAASGETEGAGTDDAQGQHFITFVHVDGRLYELDGRTFGDDGVAFPVDHGATTGESFVSDAARVIREDFMKRDPTSINFNITALCALEG